MVALSLALTVLANITNYKGRRDLGTRAGPSAPMSSIRFPLGRGTRLSFVADTPTASARSPGREAVFGEVRGRAGIRVS